VLCEQLAGKHLRFTDGQRCRLAAKAKAIGRKELFEIGTLVTPDTVRRQSFSDTWIVFLREVSPPITSVRARHGH
jgi:hypothetical protein